MSDLLLPDENAEVEQPLPDTAPALAPALAPGGADPAVEALDAQRSAQGGAQGSATELPASDTLDAASRLSAQARQPQIQAEPEAPLGVDHIARTAHVYPGEDLQFRTRVRVRDEFGGEILGYSLEVSLPDGLEIIATTQPPDASVPRTLLGTGERSVRWDVVGPFSAGGEFLHEMTVRVERHGAFDFDALGAFRGAPVHSTASAWPFDENGEIAGPMVAETMVVEVRPKAGYLRYLPALYERDPLMSRFLMLFESFWGPLDMQVRNISDYFDPMLMPLPLLRWLGERFDLEILPEWPELTQRRMLANAVGLYRKRGTRAGLQRLLEIYSGGQVVINEHRADNFRLGKQARLGQGVALGAGNKPFSFAVRITLPPLDATGLAPEEVARQQEVRVRRLRALIDAEKPAHVTYALDVVESAPFVRAQDDAAA